MSRRSRLWWFRQSPTWMAADLINRAGWCWSDLVDWAFAFDPQHPEWPRDERRLWDVGRRKSVCARQAIDPTYTNTGSCYCGQVGPESPGEQRRREVRARMAPYFAAVAVATVVFGVLSAAAAVPPAVGPAERVPYDVGPTLAPPPNGPGAELVREQLADARDGVAP